MKRFYLVNAHTESREDSLEIKLIIFDRKYENLIWIFKMFDENTYTKVLDINESFNKPVEYDSLDELLDF